MDSRYIVERLQRRIWSFLAMAVLSLSLCYPAWAGPYDQTTIQYSPEGRVLQLEYAKEAIAARGGPIVGMKAADGLLVITGNINPTRSFSSNLIMPVINEGSDENISANRKTCFIDGRRICVSVTGLDSDAQVVIDAAKKICNEYKPIYESDIPVESLCDTLAEALHAQTRKRHTRPLAIAALVGGYDDDCNAPCLYTIDTEGSYSSHRACYIGRSLGEKGSLLHEALIELLDSQDVERGGIGINQLRARLEDILVNIFDSDFLSDSNNDDFDDEDKAERVKGNPFAEANVHIGRITDTGAFKWTSAPTRLTKKHTD